MTDETRDPEDDFLGLVLSSIYRRVRNRDGDEGASTALETVQRARPQDEEIPKQLAGYKVLGRLGHGGVGIVLRVVDPILTRDLAMKILARAYADQREMIEHFKLEAEICGRLQHPGVVPIHELGELDDDRPYFTMKIVEGQTLAVQLSTREHPGDDRQSLLETFGKICQAMAYVHTQGIVHTDLKPANIMVGAFGEVQIMDWGFAIEMKRRRDDVTHIGGTPSYMAPEQARGDIDRIDERSDVFGLGALLCEIITGAPPYLGENKSEILLKASRAWLEDANARLEACAGDRELVALAKWCLSPDPDDRPADAGAVAKAIRDYLSSLEQRARSLEVATAKAAEERRAHRMLVGLLATIVVGLVGYLWMDWQQEAQAREVRQGITQAIERATLLRDQARAAKTIDLDRWNQAAVAARQANEFASASGVDPALRARTATLLGEITASLGNVQQDKRMLDWLEKVRPHISEHKLTKTGDIAHEEAFARYGIDTRAETLTPAAERIRGSNLRPMLVTALLDWALDRRQAELEPKDRWLRLLELADLADEDSWRADLRKALRSTEATDLEQLAESARKHVVSAENLRMLASALVVAKKSDTAIRTYRLAHARFPGDFWVLHDFANCLGGAGDAHLQECERILAMALASRPRSAHAMTDLANHYMRREMFTKAERLLKRAIARDRAYSLAHEALGRLHVRRNDLKRARRAFRRCLILAPTNSRAEIGLATVYMREGQHGRAAKHFAAAFVKQPENGKIAVDLAAALRRAGRPREALPYYRKAFELGEGSAELHCNYGYVLTLCGRYKEAVVERRRGHELGSKRDDWTYPSDEWVVAAEDLAARQDALLAVIAGDRKTKDPDEEFDAALLAYRRERHAAATRLYLAAFAHDPDHERGRWHNPYNAACAALLASAGKGQDAAGVPKTERDAWRKQALKWLSEELDYWQTALHDGKVANEHVQGLMAHWRKDPDLASVRGDALAGLPASEAKGWRDLWVEVTKLAGR